MGHGVTGISIERNAAVTFAEYDLKDIAINDYIMCDGPEAIAFIAHNGSTEVTFTLKSGEVNEVPFYFTRLTWKALTGTSAFRCFAHK